MLSSRQFSEWMAYYAIEPFGEYASYLRTGIIAATIANVNRGRRGRTFSPEDFMPKGFFQHETTTTPKVQSVEEQKEAIMRIFNWGQKKGMAKKGER